MNARPAPEFFEGLDDGLPSRRAAVSYENDPKWAYLQWLTMEARLLRMELMPAHDAELEFSPASTFAHDFHLPLGRSWKDCPQPSTRAETVLRAVGVVFPNDEVDELAAAAAIEFEPWSCEDPLTVRNLHESCGPAFFHAVIADQMTQLSKAELIEGCRMVGYEATVDIVEQIGNARTWFQGLAELCAIAEGRLMSALAVTLLEEEPAAA